MKTVMCSNFDALISRFEKYFSKDMEKYNWIRNSFVENANALKGFTTLEAEQYIDRTSDFALKTYTTLIHSFRFGLKLELNFHF